MKANVIISISFVIIFVVLLLLNVKKILGDGWLDKGAKIASIVSLIISVVSIIYPISGVNTDIKPKKDEYKYPFLIDSSRSSNTRKIVANSILIDGPVTYPEHYILHPNSDCLSNQIAMTITRNKEAKKDAFKYGLKLDGDPSLTFCATSNYSKRVVEVSSIERCFYLARPGTVDFSIDSSIPIKQTDSVRLIIQDGSAFDGIYFVSVFCSKNGVNN